MQDWIISDRKSGFMRERKREKISSEIQIVVEMVGFFLFVNCLPFISCFVLYFVVENY